MSVVVTVVAVGVVTANSAVLLGIAATVAATLGLRTVRQGEDETESRRLDERHEAWDQQNTEVETVVVSTETEQALAGLAPERCQIELVGENIRLMVSRDIRGILTIRAKGEGLGAKELKARANQLLGLIRQQIAYREVVHKLKERGFQVREEDRQADGTVRVRVSKGR